MTFTEIIKDELTNLPLFRKPENDFRELLFEKLDRFDKIIQESNDLSSSVNEIEFKPEVFKRRNHTLIEGIKKTVDAYYAGNPSDAYTIIDVTIKNSAVIGYLNKDFNIPVNSNFYRIRKVDSNYPLTVNEIFHIPFNMREQVATQRFSIPGFPSLYIANSLFVAWEELGRPSYNFIQASRFKNNKELRLLDLTNDIYQNGHLINGNEAHGWQLLYFVMVWPLIAAYSVKVPKSDVAFKPEYIIPQLLLQWINKNKLDGIKYSSTHINTLQNKHIGHLYNLVIPVKTIHKNSGFCDQLIKTFSVSKVVPMQITQFTDKNDEVSEVVNKEVESIELIEGKSVLYSNTTFGKVEKFLNNLDDKQITNT